MKPTEKEIMASYLADMQKEAVTLEKIKKQVEEARTENWALEKRNNELKDIISDIESKEKNLKLLQEDFNKRNFDFDQKEKAFKNEQQELYQKQLKFSDDIQNCELLKTDLETRNKNLSDKENAIEAREYEVEIDKGKLEQKLKAYRDKLKL